MVSFRTLRGSLSPAARGALFYFGFFAAVGAFVPFLNVYFVQLGLSGRQIGLLATLFPAATLVYVTPLATWADRRRWRVRVLTGAATGVALLFSLFGLPRTFGFLAWLMVLLSFFFTPILSIADSLIARSSQRHNLNYGGMRLWGSIGFATSAVSCGALWEGVGYGPMFLLGSALFLPVIWFASRLEEGPAVAERARRPVSELGRDAGLVAILVATFLIGVSTSVVITFEGMYMAHLGGGQLLIGMVPAISAFSELPTMRYSGHIARRLGGARTLLLAYGLQGGAFLGYALSGAPWMLLLLAVAKGLGFGLLYPSTVRLITERAPEEWSATAQALMGAGMFGLAPLIAGPLGGTIYDGVGPASVFVLGSAAVGSAALVMVLAVAKGVLD